ncbi:hypothetical protein Hanom_Chr04g00376371 [Helianthus anomalus]
MGGGESSRRCGDNWCNDGRRRHQPSQEGGSDGCIFQAATPTQTVAFNHRLSHHRCFFARTSPSSVIFIIRLTL